MLQLDAGDVDKAVDDGVDGEARRRMNLKLAGYIATMGDDGINRDAETVGYLLVEQSLNNTDDDIFLAVGECLAIILPALEDHSGDIL